jgi:hypothetical protein
MSGTRRKPGRLGSQVEGYRAWLVQRGYTPTTVRNMLTHLGHVGRWLSSQDLNAERLNEEQIAAFLASRFEVGHRRGPGPRAMVPLLSYLGEVGLTSAEQPSPTPLSALLGQYRSWMVRTGTGTGAWPRVRSRATRTPHAASCKNRHRLVAPSRRRR